MNRGGDKSEARENSTGVSLGDSIIDYPLLHNPLFVFRKSDGSARPAEHLLDLFSLIETVALYERIWLISGDKNDRAFVDLSANNPIADRLMTSGVLQLSSWLETLSVGQCFSAISEFLGETTELGSEPEYLIPHRDLIEELSAAGDEFSTLFRKTFQILMEEAKEPPGGITSVFKQLSPEEQAWYLGVLTITADRSMEEFLKNAVPCMIPQLALDQLLSLSTSDKVWRTLDGSEGLDRTEWMSLLNPSNALARKSIAHVLEVDYCPSFTFSVSLSVASTQVIRSAAARLYRRLEQKARLKVEALKEEGMPGSIYIPPIAALVLQRSNGTIDSVAAEMMSVREEFASFRRRYISYQSALRNPAGKSLAELDQMRSDYRADIERSIKGLGEPSRRRWLSELFSSQISVGEEDISASLSLSGLLGLAAQEINLWIKRGRARCLFDVWDHFYNMQDYHDIIARRLQLDVGEKELREANRLHSVMSKILKDEDPFLS